MAGALTLADGLSFVGRAAALGSVDIFHVSIKIFAAGLTMGVYSPRWLVHLSDHLEIQAW